MKFIKVTNQDICKYNDWLRKAENGHILQSVEWAEFKQGEWEPHFFVIEKDGLQVGSVTALVRNIPIINRPMIYLPRGPVLLDYSDKEVWKFFRDELTEFAKSIKGIFIKLDPAVTIDNPCNSFLEELGFISQKTTIGFGGIQPAATIRNSLKGSMQDAFERIPGKTRYNVRYPEKKGVVYERKNDAGIDEFYEIMECTAKRGKFTIRPKEYYRVLFKHYKEDVTLITATYEDTVIAAGMYLKYGNKSWGLYSGASDEHTNLKAFHGLIWKGMEWSKERDASYFDFYGIPVERLSEDSQSTKAYGIYKFKKSFGGDEYDFIGEFDLPVNKPLYLLSQKFMGARNLAKKIVKKLKG